jgi:hypothetical protein
MAHFAELTAENIVTRVIVVGDGDCLDENGNESEAAGIAFCQSLFGAESRWVQTSYNSSIRGKYAGVGDTYDPVEDIFVSPIIEPVPVQPPVPEPQWVAFGAMLAADESVNAMVAVAADTAPVLHLMLGVGLGQAAQGDTQTFSAAWAKALEAGLVSAELAAHVVEVGTACDLPAEFLAGLTPATV